jgi:hypothetical protein
MTAAAGSGVQVNTRSPVARDSSLGDPAEENGSGRSTVLLGALSSSGPRMNETTNGPAASVANVAA